MWVSVCVFAGVRSPLQYIYYYVTGFEKRGHFVQNTNISCKLQLAARFILKFRPSTKSPCKLPA